MCSSKTSACYTSIKYVKEKLFGPSGATDIQGTGVVSVTQKIPVGVVTAAQKGSDSDSSSSHSGMYAAIGVTVGVIGLVAVAVIIYLIMRQKYATKEAVAVAVATSGSTRRSPGMIAETASGIGNPVYSMYGTDDASGKMAMDDVDMSDMFAPSEATLPRHTYEGTLGQQAVGNPLYSDPYGALDQK